MRKLEAEFRKRAERVAAELKGVPGLETRILVPDSAANRVPHLLIRYDRTRIKASPLDVAAELRRGAPPIELNPQTGQKPGAGLPSDENTIVVGVWMLQPGEDSIVGRRLREALAKLPA